MKQDEILEALHKVVQENKHYTTWTVSTPHLVALVNLAIEHEREACAKVCETLGVHPALNVWNGGPDWYKHGKDCAEAIRARGQ